MKLFIICFSLACCKFLFFSSKWSPQHTALKLLEKTVSFILCQWFLWISIYTQNYLTVLYKVNRRLCYYFVVLRDFCSQAFGLLRLNYKLTSKERNTNCVDPRNLLAINGRKFILQVSDRSLYDIWDFNDCLMWSKIFWNVTPCILVS
jgi:hypothetical protein